MNNPTLGTFLAERMRKLELNNSSLALAAGISEGAVRNLLRYGLVENTKDPNARTLRRVAEAIQVSPLVLYRLVGYLPAETSRHSIRAEFVADTFDGLTHDKQDAVLGVIDAMANAPEVSKRVRAIRQDIANPLAGFDLHSSRIVRLIANALVARYQMTEEVDVERIEDNVQIYQHRWRDLPAATQERVKALIRHKLSLDYDPTMVDPEWRE